MTETTATAAGPTGRVGRLLAAIRAQGGRWGTDRAACFYRDHGIAPRGARGHRTRAVARGDLRDLAAWGHLTAHGPDNNRTYTITTSTTGEPT